MLKKTTLILAVFILLAHPYDVIGSRDLRNQIVELKKQLRLKGVAPENDDRYIDACKENKKLKKTLRKRKKTLSKYEDTISQYEDTISENEEELELQLAALKRKMKKRFLKTTKQYEIANEKAGQQAQNLSNALDQEKKKRRKLTTDINTYKQKLQEEKIKHKKYKKLLSESKNTFRLADEEHNADLSELRERYRKEFVKITRTLKKTQQESEDFKKQQTQKILELHVKHHEEEEVLLESTANDIEKLEETIKKLEDTIKEAQRGLLEQATAQTVLKNAHDNELQQLTNLNRQENTQRLNTQTQLTSEQENSKKEIAEVKRQLNESQETLAGLQTTQEALLDAEIKKNIEEQAKLEKNYQAELQLKEQQVSKQRRTLSELQENLSSLKAEQQEASSGLKEEHRIESEKQTQALKETLEEFSTFKALQEDEARQLNKEHEHAKKVLMEKHTRETKRSLENFERIKRELSKSEEAKRVLIDNAKKTAEKLRIIEQEKEDLLNISREFDLYKVDNENQIAENLLLRTEERRKYINKRERETSIVAEEHKEEMRLKKNQLDDSLTEFTEFKTKFLEEQLIRMNEQEAELEKKNEKIREQVELIQQYKEQDERTILTTDTNPGENTDFPYEEGDSPRPGEESSASYVKENDASSILGLSPIRAKKSNISTTSMTSTINFQLSGSHYPLYINRILLKY